MNAIKLNKEDRNKNDLIKKNDLEFTDENAIWWVNQMDWENRKEWISMRFLPKLENRIDNIEVISAKIANAVVYGLLTEEDAIMKDIEEGIRIYLNRKLMKNY